jgi:prefoldin subunit 5
MIEIKGNLELMQEIKELQRQIGELQNEIQKLNRHMHIEAGAKHTISHIMFPGPGK